MSFTQLIPVFIVSGESEQRYRDFCTNLGARGYFQKPVDFAALEKKLAEVLGTKRQDRRSEVRIKLCVKLKLAGASADGQLFELLTMTENVSAHGFLCACTATIKKDSMVEVILMSAGQQRVGRARVVRIEWQDTPGQRCAFRFIDDPVDWVLR